MIVWTARCTNLVMTQIKGRGMVEAKRSTAQLKAKIAWRVRLEELEAKKAQEASSQASPAALAAASALAEEIEAKKAKKARKAAKVEATGRREAEAEAPTDTATATTAAAATTAEAATTTKATAGAEAAAATSSAPAPCPYKVHTYSEDGRRTGIVEKSALLELSAAPLPGGFEDIHTAYGELGPA